VAPAPADSTMPASDGEGDACDTDDDNDGATDVAESGMTIVAWSGNTDPGGAGDAADTTTCKGPGVGVAPSVVMSTTNPDSDMDGYRDGQECTMSARPDEDDTAVASCTTVPVDPDGCARIERSGVTDPDADKLYHPTSGLGHDAVEAFYRTRGINTDEASQEHDTDNDTLDGEADSDSDADTLIDGIEVWGWGTDPSNEDTDHDACADGKEAADVNGNRVVNAQDLGILASTTTYGTVGGSYRNAGGIIPAQYHKLNGDQNRNFIINAQDLGLAAAQNLIGGGSCNVPTIDANPAPGNASVNAQRGLVITNQRGGCVEFATQPGGPFASGVPFPTQPAVDDYCTPPEVLVTLSVVTISGPAGTLVGCAANPLVTTAGTATFAGCAITKGAGPGTYALVAITPNGVAASVQISIP
jgi:hypothetical protein